MGLIKSESGPQFFSNLEQMYADITISEEQTRNYLAGDPRKKKTHNFELEFFIIASGSWPIASKQQALQLPKEINDIQNSFEKFYKEQFKGKMVQWNIDFCTSLIKGTFQNEGY